MQWTKQKLINCRRISIALLCLFNARLLITYNLPIWELAIMVLLILFIMGSQRILNLSDGMLYQLMKGAPGTDFISDKILNHTLKKKNKRYKVKKKRPRQAR